MSGRFYFYHKNEELKDHRYNGAIFGGCGPCVGWVRLGRELFMVRDRIEGIRGDDRNCKRYPIVSADFGGPVRVKEWFPNPELNEWFVLATVEQIEAAGLKLIPHDSAKGGPAKS